ncbi:dCTP deaminase, dUMP-forming [subsurface metagenome]
MILNAQHISEAYQQGNIVIDPFDEKQVQAATYDLRVGEQGATTTTKKIVNIKETGYILLQPGDFGVITVLEEIRLGPQYTGRIGLRSKYARKGLIATTGPQIDPGYHGRLIIGITNLTPNPISLPYKDDLLSVEIHRLEQATTKPYNGPYQDRLQLGPEEIEAITETEGMALSDVMKTLQSLSANVGTMAAEIKTLKWAIPVIVGLGMTIVSIIVALK